MKMRFLTIGAHCPKPIVRGKSKMSCHVRFFNDSISSKIEEKCGPNNGLNFGV